MSGGFAGSVARGVIVILSALALAGTPRTVASAGEAARVNVLTLEGQSIAFGKILASQRPRAAVVLFWSLYQPESRRALKALDRHSRSLHERGFSILTVALPEYKESPSAVAEFLSRASVRANTVMDPTGALVEVYSGADRSKTTLPLTVVLSTDGSVMGIVPGWSDGWAEAVDDIVARAEKAKS
jgi:hypothetical protein